jgi:hypothetical protein
MSLRTGLAIGGIGLILGFAITRCRPSSSPVLVKRRIQHEHASRKEISQKTTPTVAQCSPCPEYERDSPKECVSHLDRTIGIHLLSVDCLVVNFDSTEVLTSLSTVP